MPLLIAPQTADHFEAGAWTNPAAAAWFQENPPPVNTAGVGAFRHLASRPTVGWLCRLWGFWLRDSWASLAPAWRYGYFLSGLSDLLVALLLPIYAPPFLVVAVLFRRYAPLAWRSRVWTWQYRRSVYAANLREWRRQRPTRAEVELWHLGQLIAAEDAREQEEQAQRAEAERRRSVLADYVLRWIFGADEMTPDDIGPHHLEN